MVSVAAKVFEKKTMLKIFESYLGATCMQARFKKVLSTHMCIIALKRVVNDYK